MIVVKLALALCFIAAMFAISAYLIVNGHPWVALAFFLLALTFNVKFEFVWNEK